MSGPIEPARWLRLPLEVVDNPAPNDAERRLARDIAWALGWHGSIADEPTNLAGMLALVREGYTLEGPRQLVSATMTVSRLAIDGTGGEVERHATRALWRRWTDELHAHGLRPVGWPAVQRTYLDLSNTVPEHDPEHPERNGLVPVDPNGPRPWVFLELALRCEAVPA